MRSIFSARHQGAQIGHNRFQHTIAVAAISGLE